MVRKTSTDKSNAFRNPLTGQLPGTSVIQQLEYGSKAAFRTCAELMNPADSGLDLFNRGIAPEEVVQL